MTNGFAFSIDKSLQIYFFCVKHEAKKHFLKDVESTVVKLPRKCNIHVVVLQRHHSRRDEEPIRTKQTPSVKPQTLKQQKTAKRTCLGMVSI